MSPIMQLAEHCHVPFLQLEANHLQWQPGGEMAAVEV